ncbi:hypothetical protein HDU76_001393 [Blyttiomyces sp. JEL0837]|nr:hypothetical protein HDU76_001393 [Blyttiomyces sp. JEL0837]
MATAALSMSLDDLITQNKSASRAARNNRGGRGGAASSGGAVRNNNRRGGRGGRPAAAPYTGGAQVEQTKIIVSNLHTQVTDKDLRELFGTIGPVKSATLLHSDTNARSKSAMVVFKNNGDAAKAIREYHDRTLDGKPMKIDMVISHSAVNVITNPPVAPAAGSAGGRQGGAGGRGGRGGRIMSVAASIEPAVANVMASSSSDEYRQRRVALLTGITGQDGSYLTELLLSKVRVPEGYTVHGIIRRSSSFNTGRIEHLYKDQHECSSPKMILHYGDLTDSTNLVHIISQVQPTEIYNLGAQSHVKVSFDMAQYTADVDGTGTLRLLDAIRTCGLTNNVKFYQASTSEMFGKVVETPQKETTPFYPRSPYGVAKQFAYWITVNYREAYGMYACNGILFNHESPRRGQTFVTRKISRAVANIHLGKEECVFLGNIDAKRDWGHARDYVEGMWRMLQLDEPEDFVLATGETHTVREFVEKAFSHVGINIRWKGKGDQEIGADLETGKVVVRIGKKLNKQ